MVFSLRNPHQPETVISLLAKEAAAKISQELGRLWGSDRYVAANAHGASSSQVQGLLHSIVEPFGFRPETSSRVHLAGFRADYALVTDTDGILIEVERGKTIDNNMDMLDLWKTHVHGTARHLILVVPVWYETRRSIKGTFVNVCRRMAPFFEEGFYTNVHTLHIVGY